MKNTLLLLGVMALIQLKSAELLFEAGGDDLKPQPLPRGLYRRSNLANR